VTGTVTYRPRIALPPGAVITVRLQDISLADAPAVLLDEVVITTNGEQVPIPFTLTYDPAAIEDRATYAVAARIEIDGRLAFISDTTVPVITQGAPTQDVVVLVVPVG
jgi:putative lipoprotein